MKMTKIPIVNDETRLDVSDLSPRGNSKTKRQPKAARRSSITISPRPDPKSRRTNEVAGRKAIQELETKIDRAKSLITQTQQASFEVVQSELQKNKHTHSSLCTGINVMSWITLFSLGVGLSLLFLLLILRELGTMVFPPVVGPMV